MVINNLGYRSTNEVPKVVGRINKLSKTILGTTRSTKLWHSTEQDKCTMWIFPAENAEPTSHSCLLSQREIARFIALTAIKPIAKTDQVAIEALAPQDKCTASM